MYTKVCIPIFLQHWTNLYHNIIFVEVIQTWPWSCTRDEYYNQRHLWDNKLQSNYFELQFYLSGMVESKQIRLRVADHE